MPRDPDSIIFQSKPKLAKHLGLSGPKDLEQWMENDDLFASYWDDFYDGHLKKIVGQAKPGKPTKGPEIKRIQRAIIEGEKHGRRTYSRDRPKTQDWTDVDWVARLLVKVVVVNKADFEGIFYQNSTLSDQEMNERVFQVYKRKRHELAPGRQPAGKKGKKDEGTQSSPPPPPTRPGSPANKRGGEAIVKNVLSDEPSAIFLIDSLASYTFAQFTEAVEKHFQLRQSQLQVDFFISDLGTLLESKWEAFQQAALAQPGRMDVSVYTTDRIEGMDEVGEFADPADIERQTVHPYEKMWRERGSDAFDLRYRWWQFTLLKRVGKGERAEVKFEDLRVPSEDDDEDADGAMEEALAWRKHLSSLTAKAKFEDEEGEVEILDDAADEDVTQTMCPVITPKEKQAFRQMEEMLNNPKLQRDDYDEACAFIHCDSPEYPRMRGMPRNKKLLFWQPPAIKGLVEMIQGPLRGALCADIMGLGKTIEGAAVLQHFINMRADCTTEAELEAAGLGPPRPTLLIVPHIIIDQWINKLREFFPELIIYKYHGASKKASQNEVQILTKLDKSHPIFNTNNPRNANVVIITSKETFARRHGPELVRKIRVARLVRDDGMTRKEALSATRKKHEFRRYEDFPQSLRGLIGLLIVDEAHEVSNEDSQVAIALHWTKAEKKLLMSATPYLTDPIELAGLYSLLPPEGLWTKSFFEELGLDISQLTEIDPWELDDEHPGCILRYSGPSLYHDVFKNKELSPYEKAKRFRLVLEGTCIRRNTNSKISGKPIGAALPEKRTNTRLLDYKPDEKKIAQSLASSVKKGKYEALEFDTQIFKKQILWDHWLDFEYMLDYKAKKVREFRKNEKTTVDFVCEMWDRKAAAGVKTDFGLDANVEAILKMFAWNSPKHRELFRLIAELVVLMEEKLIVWVMLPAQQLALTLALQAAGLDARAFSADLKKDQRIGITDSFNGQGGCQILVASYLVSSFGIEWQSNCRNVVLFSEAPGPEIEKQAVGRIYRYGQGRWVRVERFYMKTANAQLRLAKYLLRAIPAIMADLNLELYGDKEESGVINLGRFCRVGEKLVPADSAEAQGLKPLEADEVLMFIQRQLTGMVGAFEKP